VLVFAVSANLLLMLQLEGTLRAAYLIGFWVTVLLSSLYSFAHQLRQQKLQQQLNRDPETRLLNRNQLFKDLHKELERAQREDTQLGLLIMQRLDQGAFDASTAQAITGLLASFEKLYTASSHQLCVLLPMGSAEQLPERCNRLQEQLPQLQLRGHHCPLTATAEALLQQISQPDLSPDQDPIE
jgi:hypothetical protein